MKLNIKYSASLVTLFLTVASTQANFNWGASTPILGPDDVNNQGETSFTTALQPSASPFSASGGFLVQLIRVAGGKDGAINNGTTGLNDDQIIAATYIGSVFGSPNDGLFNTDSYTPNNDGSYYVRAWAGVSTATTYDQNAPIPEFGANNHLFYGDSAVFVNGQVDPPSLPPTINFGSTSSGGGNVENPIIVNQLLLAVPEPATFALFGMGFLALFYARKRRKAVTQD